MSYTIPAIASLPQFYPAGFPLALIAAIARNRVIGRNGQLIWHLPEDLQHFRMLTSGHTIIMGRKTWESLPHALPQRQNIVVTRQPGYAAANAIVAPSLDAALGNATLPAPVFCIGGGELYREALPRSSVLFLTEIDHDFAGDAFFPAFDAGEWQRIVHEPQQQTSGERLRYAFSAYVRKAVWQTIAGQAAF